MQHKGKRSEVWEMLWELACSFDKVLSMFQFEIALSNALMQFHVGFTD